MSDTVVVTTAEGEEEAPLEEVIEQARELGNHDARIDVLEGRLTECLSEISSLRTLLETTLNQSQQAQEAAAEAQQEALQAEAMALAAMTEPEEEVTEASEVTEVEPDGDEEGPASQTNQPKWWERLLVGQ